MSGTESGGSEAGKEGRIEVGRERRKEGGRERRRDLVPRGFRPGGGMCFKKK